MSSTATDNAVIIWAGIDVSQEVFDLVLLPAQGQGTCLRELSKLPHFQYPRTQQGVEQMLAQLPQDKIRFVMESTGRYSVELACWLRELAPSQEVSIVNPRRVLDHARSLGTRTRTDRIDAGIIASFARDRHPAPWNPPCASISFLQALSRTRQSLVESRTRHSNQLQDLMRAGLSVQMRGKLLAPLEQLLESLKEQIAAFDEMIEQLLAKELQIKADVETLDTIPGVGITIASGVMCEMGDLRRFTVRGLAEIFAGVNVGRKQSGKKEVCRGMSKEGSARVRRLLYLAAMAAVKGNNALASFYQRLISRGKNKRCAMAAVGRKILSIMRRLLITGKEYDDALVGGQK